MNQLLRHLLLLIALLLYQMPAVAAVSLAQTDPVLASESLHSGHAEAGHACCHDGQCHADDCYCAMHGCSHSPALTWGAGVPMAVWSSGSPVALLCARYDSLFAYVWMRPPIL